MASFDDEYALFKLEIEGIDNLSDSKNDPNQEEGSNEMTDNLDTKGSGHEENTTEVAPESILVPDIDNELNYLKGESVVHSSFKFVLHFFPYLYIGQAVYYHL